MKTLNTPDLEASASIRADSLIQIIGKAFNLIGTCWKYMTKRMFFSDLFAVTASIGFVTVPAALVGLIFLILPQGRDALLIIIEQQMSCNWFPLFFLLLAVVIWSMFSELAVRYAISISDNSGINLSDIRVLWRKTIQKLLAGVFLLWPGFLVLVGFVIVFFSAEYIDLPKRLLYIGIPIVLLMVLLWTLSFLYFHKFKPKGPRKSKTTLLGHRALPANEQKWLNKLYGIYNDYLFTLPKPTNFKGHFKDELQDFTNLYLGKNAVVDADKFPQDKSVLDKDRAVPEEFELLNRGNLRKSTGIYKWVYCMPPLKVYPEFHKQVQRVALTGFALLVLMSIIPAEWQVYAGIGAPALVCLAFACYTGIYIGLLYIDKVLLPRFPLSIRLVLVLWVIFVSWVNQDHPVRLHGLAEHRPALQAHFDKWFQAYKSDVDQRLGDTLSKYPVVFVCAEGGAFRTGAYTALFLTQMEAELAKRDQPVDLRHSIYAMSGVSGGAVGLGFYNAVAFRSGIPFRDTATVQKTRKFFLHDSLSPLIGKMFFSEFLNLFYWQQAELFDRAVALEKSWESAYNNFAKGNRNTYGDEFLLPDTGRTKPMLLINTAEVETGLQCWMSNVQTDSLLFAVRRDLLCNKIGNTRYSTAINFSSRFPLFSPGAKIDIGNHRLHYLDGGYIENTGSATMLEILNELRKTATYKKIVPVVISLRFSEAPKDTSDIKLFNEFSEIVSGPYNTRSGRNETATYLLEHSLRPEEGIFITAPLLPKEQKIPMNWVLSSQSMDYIQEDIGKKLSPNGAIIRDFFRKDLTYLPLNPIKHQP